MNRADYADNGVILNTTTKMIDGALLDNTSLFYHGLYYACGSDGIAVRLNTSGWTEVGDNKYYSIKKGALANSGDYWIEGIHYLFADDGRLIKQLDE